MAFEPEKITKQHVLDAVEEIEKEIEKGIKLSKATKYHVIINGKAYPPKEIMRYAHKQMNGYKASPHGGEETNKYLRALGFEIKKFGRTENVEEPLQEKNKENIEFKQTNMPLNQILFGPPGTGKTYNSIDKAVAIVTGSSSDHQSNKKVFDELKKEGQIEFVTFHQNYSYEDFMLGLKPDIEFDNLRFVSSKGIFYNIAKRAKENYFASNKTIIVTKTFEEAFSELLKPLIEDSVEIEIKMTSGKKLLITDITEYSIYFKKPQGISNHTLSIQTLKGIVENTKEITGGLASYYLPIADEIRKMMIPVQNQNFKLKNYVLIIDEINRANISKVFGELITLLEDDKRLGADNELKITLPNGEKEFGVPPNLYLIGTMNTADKSIALIDIALRRRFEFVGFYPDYEVLDYEASDLLQKINQEIYKLKNSADYLIGHAYFMKQQPIEVVLKNKVIPLLMEYFSGKTQIISGIFNATSWKVEYDLASFEWKITKS